jgi:hypothetical protein
MFWEERVTKRRKSGGEPLRGSHTGRIKIRIRLGGR